jgi:hypothetical protein
VTVLTEVDYRLLQYQLSERTQEMARVTQHTQSAPQRLAAQRTAQQRTLQVLQEAIRKQRSAKRAIEASIER